MPGFPARQQEKLLFSALPVFFLIAGPDFGPPGKDTIPIQDTAERSAAWYNQKESHSGQLKFLHKLLFLSALNLILSLRIIAHLSKIFKRIFINILIKIIILVHFL